MFNKDYIQKLTSRAESIFSQFKDVQMPHEVQSLFNQRNFSAFISNTWKEPNERPFSPLIKQMTSDVIGIGSPLTAGERQYLLETAELINQYYGEPLGHYNGTLKDDLARIKMGQNFRRMGPKVTRGSTLRRYANLQKYLGKTTFMPDPDTLALAVSLFLNIANISPIDTDFSPSYVRGLFTSHSSNLGFPYFSNETSTVNGVLARDLSVRLTKQLNDKYGSKWMVTIPSVIIGRDQAGGLDIDVNQCKTMKDIRSIIPSLKYNDSKARVVGAIDRISNNNINVVLKKVLDNDGFKTNPFFCGFRDRDYRANLYAKYHALCVDKGGLPVNVDFASFDTTISPEMLVLAIDIIFSGVRLHKSPSDLQEATIFKTIFTKYIVKNPNTGLLEHGMKYSSIPSGIGLTGLAGFVVAQISWLYALITYYGATEISEWIASAKRYGTFPFTGLGDDLLAAVKKFSDLPALADVIAKTFGMNISVDGVKTAVGVDFLQELYVDGKVLYPTPRTLQSAFYTERAKGLGFAQGEMAWASQLYNIKDNNDLQGAADIIKKGDACRLGHQDTEGMPLTINGFLSKLKEELAEQNKTAKQVLGDGDPNKESRYTTNGDISSTFLKGFWLLGIRNASNRGTIIDKTNERKRNEKEKK